MLSTWHILTSFQVALISIQWLAQRRLKTKFLGFDIQSWLELYWLKSNQFNLWTFLKHYKQFRHLSNATVRLNTPHSPQFTHTMQREQHCLRETFPATLTLTLIYNALLLGQCQQCSCLFDQNLFNAFLVSQPIVGFMAGSAVGNGFQRAWRRAISLHPARPVHVSSCAGFMTGFKVFSM